MSVERLLRFVTDSDIRVECAPWGARADLCRPGLTEADRLSIVRVRMPPGRAHAFHRHPSLEEVIYIIAGQVEQWVGHESRILKSGELAHIPRNVVHGTYNVGTEPVVFLAILSPASPAGPTVVDVSGEEPWRSMRPSERRERV